MSAANIRTSKWQHQSHELSRTSIHALRRQWSQGSARCRIVRPEFSELPTVGADTRGCLLQPGGSSVSEDDDVGHGKPFSFPFSVSSTSSPSRAMGSSPQQFSRSKRRILLGWDLEEGSMLKVGKRVHASTQGLPGGAGPRRRRALHSSPSALAGATRSRSRKQGHPTRTRSADLSETAPHSTACDAARSAPQSAMHMQQGQATTRRSASSSQARVHRAKVRKESDATAGSPQPMARVPRPASDSALSLHTPRARSELWH